MNFGCLSIQPLDLEGDRLVKLNGELDLLNRDQVLAAFAITEGLRHLTVDTTELTFIDCTGLGALLMARKQLGDRFSLIPGPATLRLLELSGAGKTFGIDIKTRTTLPH